MCVANFHASARVALAEEELRDLWQLALDWAAGSPLVLGGDLNLRRPVASDPGVVHLASRDVDHLFGRGVRACAPARILERCVRVDGMEVELSDHPPLLVEVERAGDSMPRGEAPGAA
jgi:hypothetical protein